MLEIDTKFLNDDGLPRYCNGICTLGSLQTVALSVFYSYTYRQCVEQVVGLRAASVRNRRQPSLPEDALVGDGRLLRGGFKDILAVRGDSTTEAF